MPNPRWRSGSRATCPRRLGAVHLAAGLSLLALQLTACDSAAQPSAADGGRGTDAAMRFDAGNDGGLEAGAATDSAPPSPDREILFDGSSLEGWQHASGQLARWRIVDGALEVVPGSGDLETKVEHDDIHLHVEFNVPATDPSAMEQDRGNSGVFLQSRYEVQVLDSFGRTLADRNDAGAIYGVRDADSNQAQPPDTWQTYEIRFIAARWEGGAKVTPARISVSWNGTPVQRDVEVPSSIGDPEAPTPGPLRLQDHGHRVRYRNLWLERL